MDARTALLEVRREIRVLLTRISIAAAGLLVVLGRYETLEPCEMLRFDVERRVLAMIAAGEPSGEFAALGTLHGMNTLHQLLQATTADRAPGECLATLLRFNADPRLLGGFASSHRVDDSMSNRSVEAD